jgi:polysaccharide biosynthesis/export protein
MKKLSVFFLSCLLGACNTTPGMQNLDISQMQQQSVSQEIKVHPILVRITPSLLTVQPNPIYVYHIAPSDILDISVWQHPEFSSQNVRAVSTSTPSIQGAAGQPGYLVNPQGIIYFPLVGYVHVGNRAIDAVRRDITYRLSRYIKNPQVNVRVADFRGQKVYVQGEVMKPGFIPLNDQLLTITDALAMTGSIDPNAADTRHVYVIRGVCDTR